MEIRAEHPIRYFMNVGIFHFSAWNYDFDVRIFDTVIYEWLAKELR